MTKQKAKDMTMELVNSGFGIDEVIATYCDGEYLKSERYTQEEAELLHSVAKEIKNKMRRKL